MVNAVLPDQNGRMYDFGACTDFIGIGPVLCIGIKYSYFKKKRLISVFSG